MNAPLLRRSVTSLLTAAVLCALLPRVAAFGDLRNVSLTGCVLLEDPYIVRDSTRRMGYSGIAFTYLERLQDNLQFALTVTHWNDTWTAFIEAMSDCDGSVDSGEDACPCQIGIGAFTMTNERAEKINFVWALSNEAHKMVLRKSDLREDGSQNTWFVFRTFSLEVWGIIVGGVFMHAVGTVFFGPFRPPHDDAKGLEPKGWFPRILWQIKHFPAAVVFSYAHLIGHPFGERGQGTPSFHRTAWLVLGVTTGLFLLTVYEASLTVLLFESTKVSPFRTLRDIKDCSVSPEKVAMIEGGASQDLWNSAINTTQNRNKCPEWTQVGMTVADIDEGFRFLQARKADFFYSLEGSVLFRASRNCEDFETVGEPFFSTAVGFVLPKKTESNLLEILSSETRKLREEDAYPSASLLAARNSCEPTLDATITSGKLWTFFVLYAAMWLWLLSYRCVFLWRRRRSPSQSPPAVDSDGSIVVMNMHSMPARDTTRATHPQNSTDPFD